MGVNAPYGGNGHCNGSKIAEDGSGAALIDWMPDRTFRHTVEMAIAKMSCAACAYATVRINWDDIYNWVFTKHPGWWPAVQQVYSTAQTSIDLELMTFRKSSDDHPRVKVWHRGWKLWHD